MAHKKAAGSAKNLRDSNSKYRGVKLFGGQTARAGNIIIRQKGDKFQLGKNVYKGADFTIHAAIDGIVTFRKKNITKYNGRVYLKTVVEVVSAEEAAANAKTKVKAQATKDASIASKNAVEKKAPVAKKPAAPKTAPKKATAPKAEKKAEKAAPAKKPVAKKTEAKAAPAKKAAPKKAAAKKPAAKKPAAKKKAE
jgi:large subunit ribosomal protein L27